MKQMICCLALAAALAGIVTAEPPKAVSPGKTIDDWRLKPLKDLNGYFPFEPSNSKAEWNARAKLIRRRILVANGLWPMPTKTPLKAVVHGKIEFDTYTVEKVYFQSMPGLYVTGNLYRPKNAPGKCPAVLCPHGHFADGRFGASSIKDVRTQITQGAERFEDGGRNSIQARCVGLARLGCVVFNYDMIGYCDSAPISYELAHRFAKQRADMNSTTEWGLFSPRAESHAQSVMGLQTYNSIRALDWIETLPDVDSSRLAVTGASGGGTQTFLLCAVDPRPAVAVPAVMVSTAMQGGCTCENCSLLRIGDAGNVTFAALFAPKPLCVLSANDWTVEMPTKGFPQLRQHYAMMGAEANVRHVPLLHFGHNYNYVSRANMYAWMNKYLSLGHDEPIVEDAYHRLTRDELTVWDDQHPKPVMTSQAEKDILSWWTRDSAEQIATARSNRDSHRRIVGGALETLIHRRADRIGELDLTAITKRKHDEYIEITGLIRNPTTNGDEYIPTVSLMPDGWHNDKAVIWLHPNGKRQLYTNDGELVSAAKTLLSKGVAILGADLFMQGEFLDTDQPLTTTRRVANPREAAAYSFGYNDTLFVRRVHDVLTVVAFAANHDRKPATLTLVGLDSTGPIAAAARTACGNLVDMTIVDSQSFRFHNVNRMHDPNFLPAGAKYGDLPGILSLIAPAKLHVFGESKEGTAIVRSTYDNHGAPEAVTFAGNQNILDAIVQRVSE